MNYFFCLSDYVSNSEKEPKENLLISSLDSLLGEEKEKKSGTSLNNIFSNKIGVPSKSENSDTIQNKSKNIPEYVSKGSEQSTDELVLCKPDNISPLNTSFDANKKDSEIIKVQSPNLKYANFVFQINTPGLVLSDSQIKEIVARVKIKNEPISLNQQLDEKQKFR